MPDLTKLPRHISTLPDLQTDPYELAQYLSSGDFKEIVVPSAVDAMMKTLQDKVSELRAEWESDIDYRKGEL